LISLQISSTFLLFWFSENNN